VGIDIYLFIYFWWVLIFTAFYVYSWKEQRVFINGRERREERERERENVS
jgi:hypothetical protein